MTTPRSRVIKRAPSAQLRTNVGAQLRTARLEVNKTQAEVARATDMNQGHLSEVERGLLNITLDTLCALAEAVGKMPVISLAPLAETKPTRRRPRT